MKISAETFPTPNTAIS